MFCLSSSHFLQVGRKPEQENILTLRCTVLHGAGPTCANTPFLEGKVGVAPYLGQNHTQKHIPEQLKKHQVLLNYNSHHPLLLAMLARDDGSCSLAIPGGCKGSPLV